MYYKAQAIPHLVLDSHSPLSFANLTKWMPLLQSYFKMDL